MPMVDFLLTTKIGFKNSTFYLESVVLESRSSAKVSV